MLEQMKAKAKEMLASGSVTRVLGWRADDFPAMPSPAFFTTADSLDALVYDKFAASNLSKHLINAGDGVTLVFLKPCDVFSYNQLVKENQINPENCHIMEVDCDGNVAVDDLEDAGLLERCRVCDQAEGGDRFAGVVELEAADADARYAFWQAHLSRCIRCNACRNVCPACHCKKCVFDNNKYDVAQKANVTSFEEQMFHIIRAYHVAGRCTDCGECSRACPQKIRLHLLNRKFIKDINEFFGEYQAGADTESLGPLTNFDIDADKASLKL